MSYRLIIDWPNGSQSQGSLDPLEWPRAPCPARCPHQRAPQSARTPVSGHTQGRKKKK